MGKVCPDADCGRATPPTCSVVTIALAEVDGLAVVLTETGEAGSDGAGILGWGAVTARCVAGRLAGAGGIGAATPTDAWTVTEGGDGVTATAVWSVTKEDGAGATDARAVTADGVTWIETEDDGVLFGTETEGASDGSCGRLPQAPAGTASCARMTTAPVRPIFVPAINIIPDFRLSARVDNSRADLCPCITPFAANSCGVLSARRVPRTSSPSGEQAPGGQCRDRAGRPKLADAEVGSSMRAVPPAVQSFAMGRRR